jgi:hypothetical protein
MNSLLLTCLILFSVVWLFARLADYAEETKRKKIYSEAIREVIKLSIQKRKLDELYGRTETDEDR